jgi:hypothetical protein
VHSVSRRVLRKSAASLVSFSHTRWVCWWDKLTLEWRLKCRTVSAHDLILVSSLTLKCVMWKAPQANPRELKRRVYGFKVFAPRVFCCNQSYSPPLLLLPQAAQKLPLVHKNLITLMRETSVGGRKCCKSNILHGCALPAKVLHLKLIFFFF